MKTTTIAITEEIRDKIKEFGSKGETYTDILEKLYQSAVERQLHDLLFNEENTSTVESALIRAKKKWQK